MDIFQAINSRRSIREYNPDQPLCRDEIDTILRAAMQAPSAVNQQPWRFLVLQSSSKLAQLSEIHAYGKMLATAPCGIIVCCEMAALRKPHYWEIDCAIASQNMLLACTGLGLGAVICGISGLENAQEIETLLGLPEGIKACFVIGIGHTDKENYFKERYDQTKVHRDKR